MIRIENQKAVIFDLDDTLYAEIDYVKGAFFHVAQCLASRHKELKAKILYEEMLQILLEEGRGSIFDRICLRHDLHEDIKELVQIYRTSRPDLSLYEDSKYIFAELKRQNIKIGLITDGASIVQWNKIEALQLKKCMDVITVTDDLEDNQGKKGRSKPDPEVYRNCLQKLDCDPMQATYIGDNPQKDFVGAKGLGMQTVRVIRKEGSHILDIAKPGYDADYMIHDFMELSIGS